MFHETTSIFMNFFLGNYDTNYKQLNGKEKSDPYDNLGHDDHYIDNYDGQRIL